MQPIMLYQNRQVVLSQLSPFSGQYLVKLNRSVVRPESFARSRARRVTMHKRATRKPPPAFSAPKPNRPPSRPRPVCNRRRSAHRRAELLEAARCRRAPSRARAGEPLRERLSTPFAPPSRSPASSFAHLKRILRLDRLRLRGPSGAKDEFLLAATAQKLRKLAWHQPSSIRPSPPPMRAAAFAHLTVPVDVLTAKADGGVASAATLKPSSEISASEDDIAEMGRRIDEAGNPLFI
jgi:hypothetical protein